MSESIKILAKTTGAQLTYRGGGNIHLYRGTSGSCFRPLSCPANNLIEEESP